MSLFSLGHHPALDAAQRTLARRRNAVRILGRYGHRMQSKRVADVEVVLKRSSNVTRTLTPTRVRSATGKELIAVVRIVKLPAIIWKDDLSLPRERQEIRVLGAPIGSQVTWFEPDQTLQFAEWRGIDHDPDPCCHVVRTSKGASVGPGLEVPSWRESPPAREIQAGPDGPKVGWLRANRSLEEQRFASQWLELSQLDRALLRSKIVASTALTSLPTSTATGAVSGCVDAFAFPFPHLAQLPMWQPPSRALLRCEGFGWGDLRCATAQLCREAANVFIRDLDLAEFHALDNRCVEVILDWEGCRPQQTSSEGEGRRGPTLTRWRRMTRLVVLTAEVGGRWSDDTDCFLRGLAKVRAESVPMILKGRVLAAWLRWWSSLLACSVAKVFAESQLEKRPAPHTRDVSSTHEALREDVRDTWSERGWAPSGTSVQLRWLPILFSQGLILLTVRFKKRRVGSTGIERWGPNLLIPAPSVCLKKQCLFGLVRKSSSYLRAVNPSCGWLILSAWCPLPIVASIRSVLHIITRRLWLFLDAGCSTFLNKHCICDADSALFAGSRDGIVIKWQTWQFIVERTWSTADCVNCRFVSDELVFEAKLALTVSVSLWLLTLWGCALRIGYTNPQWSPGRRPVVQMIPRDQIEDSVSSRSTAASRRKVWARTAPAGMSTRNPSLRFSGPRKSLLKIRLQIHFFVFSSMRDISRLNLISDFRDWRARSAFIRPTLFDDFPLMMIIIVARSVVHITIFWFRAIFWTSIAHFHFPFTRSLSHDTQNVILDCLSLSGAQRWLLTRWAVSDASVTQKRKELRKSLRVTESFGLSIVWTRQIIHDVWCLTVRMRVSALRSSEHAWSILTSNRVSLSWLSTC